MLRRRQDEIRIRRCRELQSRANRAHAQVAQRASRFERQSEADLEVRRASTIDLTEGRRRTVEAASAEPAFRSLSAADVEADPEMYDELQEEARSIYTSVNNTTELPSGPLPVSQEDRDMLATLRLLEITPKDDAEASRHMSIAEQLGNKVTDQRAKASAATLRNVDRVFLRGHQYVQPRRGREHEHTEETYPPAAMLFRGYKYFAGYILAENAKAESAEIDAVCQDFLAKETALRVAVAAKERASEPSDCLCDQCIICFESIPENPRTISSGWTTLKCKHGFCSECIVEWRKTSHSCPLCKKDIEVAYGATLPAPPQLAVNTTFDNDGPAYRYLIHDDTDPPPADAGFRVLSAGDDDAPHYTSLSVAS